MTGIAAYALGYAWSATNVLLHETKCGKAFQKLLPHLLDWHISHKNAQQWCAGNWSLYSAFNHARTAKQQRMNSKCPVSLDEAGRMQAEGSLIAAKSTLGRRTPQP